ncbi:hypothetical protein [Streptomyces sp. AHA2]|uniref:hypothetical protein n=1 Tax=Streptomyces sp. AHA2 TaxID=3064526 RepID=UPI002FE3EA80
MSSLFIEELDGETYPTTYDALEAWWALNPEHDPRPYDPMNDDFGPVWSNYGGWVA